jgi:hypothetical protein
MRSVPVLGLFAIFLVAAVPASVRGQHAGQQVVLHKDQFFHDSKFDSKLLSHPAPVARDQANLASATEP